MPGAGDIRAGRAYVELVTRDDKLKKGLGGVQKLLRGLGRGLQYAGAGLFAAGDAIIGTLLGTVTATVKMGDAMDKMSGRTGASVEALSELSHAAGLSGTDMATVETAMLKMQKRISEAADGSATAAENFADLGLSVEELASQPVDQQLEMVADALNQVGNESDQTRLYMDVLGRSGAQLRNLFANGSKGIQEMREQARELGLTMSTEDASAAAAFGDQLMSLWSVVKMGVFNVGSALIPTLRDLVGQVLGYVATAGKWIKENRAIFVTILKVAAGVAAAGVAMMAIGTVLTLVAGAGAGLAAIFGAIGSAIATAGAIFGLLLSPIFLVSAAIIGLGGYFLYQSGIIGRAIEYVKEQLAPLAEVATKTFQGVKDALAAGNFGLAAQIAWQGIKIAFSVGTADVMDRWDGFVRSILDTFVWMRARLTGVVVSLFSFLADNVGGMLDKFVKLSVGLSEAILGVKATLLGSDISKEMAALQRLKGMSVQQIAFAARQGAQILEESGYAANQQAQDDKSADRRSAIEQAQHELAELLKEATAEAKAAASIEASQDAKNSAQQSAGPEAISKAGGRIFGTFSTEAAKAIGADPNAGFIRRGVEETARETKRTREELQEIRRKAGPLLVQAG